MTKSPRPAPAWSKRSWIRDALAVATTIQGASPARTHIERAVRKGDLVQLFVVPLELSPTLNSFAEMETWRRKKLKEQATLLMRSQIGAQRSAPLTGRPLVCAIRFSSRECDRDSGWCKVPIDRLTPKNGGLGFIEDDKPSKLDLRAWWEPVPAGKGFCLIEVWTGGKAA